MNGTLTCPRGHAGQLPGQRFCEVCGSALVPAAAPTPATPPPPGAPPPPAAPPTLAAPLTARSPRPSARRSRNLVLGIPLLLILALVGGGGAWLVSQGGRSTPGPASSVGVIAGTSTAPASGTVPNPPASAQVSPTPSPSAPPTPPPSETPTPVPNPAGQTWFADGFDAEGAWFAGAGEYVTAAYVAGAYGIEVRPVDLPVYLWAVNESSPGPAATIEVTVIFDPGGPPTTEAGLVVQDVNTVDRLVLVVSPDGSWSLYRDDPESFRTVLRGTSPALNGGIPIRLMLELTGNQVGVSIDGQGLGAADAGLVLGSFGLAVRATEAAGQLAFDDYLVAIPRR